MIKIIKTAAILFILTLNVSNASALENCKWNNKEGTPCITVNKTSNTSAYSANGVNKKVITKQDIIDSGAISVKDLLSNFSGIDINQSGQDGQISSLFMRGTNSNHTLVLLNGIAINDQSAPNGLHNFGQDFVQTIQQVEIYKGSSGAHFGPAAIGGAINFITDVDYTNSYSASGFDDNQTIDTNYTRITDNGWHLNFKGSATQSETGSARANITEFEDDGVKNEQININAKKWLSDNLKLSSTIYSRQTKADYDGSATNQKGYTSDDKMYAIQTGLDYKKDNKEDSVIFHYNKYDREYNENGSYLDNYYSESLVVKGERKIKYSDNVSYGFGSEYKYDWAEFTNFGSFSNPKLDNNNNIYDIGISANAGYKYDDSTTLSAFVRADEHKTTDLNGTYKLNLNKLYKKFDFNITQSTGLKNPSLYELYGSNGRTDSYKHVANPNAKPEKSLTNELSIGYRFSESLYISSTGYRSSISDALLYNGSYGGGSGYTNAKGDLKQKGLETDIVFGNEEQKFSFYNSISSSKQLNGTRQLRRPDMTYGIKFFKKIYTSEGSVNLNYDYKHYGKSFDYNPGIKKIDSTDIMNIGISRDYNGMILTYGISNLLNENYQRPIGYSQEGRTLRLGVKQLF